jgi:hypothetical protein
MLGRVLHYIKWRKIDQLDGKASGQAFDEQPSTLADASSFFCDNTAWLTMRAHGEMHSMALERCSALRPTSLKLAPTNADFLKT